MKALIIGMGIGELYRSVYTNLGWNVTTCDTAKPADYTNVEDIQEHFDIAHVCTPNFTHEHIARTIADKCKIIFVEKPGLRTSDDWCHLIDTFPDTRIAMVKNNQYRDNVNELVRITGLSDRVELNWNNCNRIPNPGSWFTTKELAFGGVSRDLLPHLLSWVQVLEPNYKFLDFYGSETHQVWDLETLTSTDYGTINRDGTFDVDDTAYLTLNNNHRIFALRTSWKTDKPDDIALRFYNEGELLHEEPLGLCPESAYKKMVDSAWSHVYNDTYWEEQADMDYWIHQQLQDM